MLFAVIDRKGKIIEESVANSMINAIYEAAGDNSNIQEIVYLNGSRSDEAIRKRVKRAGYRTVQVKLVRVK